MKVNSPLDNLAGAGRTAGGGAPGPQRVQWPEKSGLARLHDAANITLSLESRFDLGYNAAHALCLAALRRLGYRAKNRYIVFQVLPHTLGLGPEVWRVLAKAHDTRNLGEYEGDLNVDERLVTDLVKAAQLVASELLKLPQP